MSGASEATFWDHLDVLRGAIVRALAVLIAFAAGAFLMKDTLFGIVLAPRSGSFVSHRWMGADDFALTLMNTGLTEQFMTHVRVALYAGLLCASPYMLYELFRFISPGLYSGERRAAVRIVGAAYVMFIAGTLVNYFVVFPLTLRFLGTYQVSADVANMLTLQSYADTLISMSLVMGAVFELPVVCAILSHAGLLRRHMMSRYRRHALVAILMVAAIITPTTDALTLLVVALPIWLLYELSIFIVKE